MHSFSVSMVWFPNESHELDIFSKLNTTQLVLSDS